MPPVRNGLDHFPGIGTMIAMGQYNHIAGYRVTCVQGCFAPVWIPAGPGADTPSLHKRLNRPCKKCDIGIVTGKLIQSIPNRGHKP